MKTEFSEYLNTFNPINRFGKTLRVIYAPRRFIENSDLHCGDGLEGKLIAKDLLYKIELWLADRDYLLISLYYNEGDRQDFRCNRGAGVSNTFWNHRLLEG
jgi:hypothetical protein